MSHYFSAAYMRNHAPLILFSVLFVLVNVGLIVSRVFGFFHMKNIDDTRNWALIIARVAGRVYVGLERLKERYVCGWFIKGIVHLF